MPMKINEIQEVNYSNMTVNLSSILPTFETRINWWNREKGANMGYTVTLCLHGLSPSRWLDW